MAENEELDLGEEKKSSLKWIIIVAVVLFLLGGGGAGMYFMGVPPFDTEEQASGEDEGGAEEAEAGEEKMVSKEPQFHQFVPIVVNFPRGSGARLLQVEFCVLSYDADSIEAITKHAPIIRNNLLLLMGRYKPQDLKSSQGKEALREAMTNEIQKVLDMQSDGSRIEAIFFTRFLME